MNHKSFVGRGGHRIEASKNFWEGSGLKVDSAFTDAAWCHGQYSNKVLTSARNGELLMWDLNKTGSTKYGAGDPTVWLYSAESLSRTSSKGPSKIDSHYGDLRVWDLRDLRKSIIRIHHPTGLRGVAFSPVVFQPLQAAVGLDNGNIFRWDLKIGQRGRLDRIPVAHTGSVTSLDWCSTSGNTSENTGNNYGWIVSGGLDRTVKVWDLTQPGRSHGHISHKPAYTLHTSFPVRRALWRPSYECEIAIVSNADFGAGSNPDMSTPTIPMTGLPSSLQPPSTSTSRKSPNIGLGLDLYNETTASTLTGGTPRTRSYAAVAGSNITPTGSPRITASGSTSGAGDLAEIWDCRRGWIAKWQITGSAVDGGLTDICFGDDPHVVWGQHYSGMFSQIDLRDATRPIDAVQRVAVGWEAGGGLTFVAGRKEDDEVPYDDVKSEERPNENRKSDHKALGDPPFVPVSQNVGSFQSADSMEDTAVFTRLAKEYILEGEDRKEVCAYNAQVAFDAGQYRAAQVWLLVETSLATVLPDLSAENSQSRHQSPGPQSATLSHSVSAPAGISGFNHSHDKDSPGRVSDHSSERVNSPNSYQQRSLSGGRKTFYTPSSSTNTSPRQVLSGLPPTPLSSSSRRFSHLGRRNSIDPASATGIRPPPISRRPSAPRRPSSSTHSASPSTSSLRHVGEGALDDSDSDSGSGSGGEFGCEEGSVGESVVHEEEEPIMLRPLISPALAPIRVSHPSPLSRVTSQQWSQVEDGGGTDGKDDAEDEASPSPRSTDSEGDPASKWKRSASSRRSSSARIKTRSRSSTMVSVQTMTSKKSTRSILRHDSSTSIKTVTALTADMMREPEDQLAGARLKSDETTQELRSAKPKHNREKSLAISELVLNGEEESRAQKAKVESRESSLSHRQQLSILEEEERYREIVWSSLRESIDVFADEVS
ncbi:SEA (Seh1-associated) complex subunit [Marasmius tenuissimus]|uniref:SEA (Seh1-associated) complex subunit n=1 Tax=Marasmius tenuissimus TaxID=585030 RepID=A0ABR2ZI23_9AGAR